AESGAVAMTLGLFDEIQRRIPLRGRLATDVMARPNSVQDREFLRRIGGFVDQRLGLQENFLGLRSRITAPGDHSLAEQYDQFELLARASLMIGKRLEQFDCALQVADCFKVGRALDRALTRFLKVFDRTPG